MNAAARKIIMNRIRKNGQDERRDYGEDYRRGRRRDYDSDYDYEDGERRRDRRDYEDERDYEGDGRRGVKGTGRYGMGGRRYYPRRRDYADEREDDYEHDERDYRDYAEESDLKIKKHDMQKWKKMLKNADGTKGEHFDKEQILPMAEKMGVDFKDYDEHEFVFVTNMMYSDYCEALRNVVTPEREALIYAKLAKAWLEDKDSPKGSEKLAIYYYCVIDKDEDENEEDFRRRR